MRRRREAGATEEEVASGGGEEGEEEEREELQEEQWADRSSGPLLLDGEARPWFLVPGVVLQDGKVKPGERAAGGGSVVIEDWARVDSSVDFPMYRSTGPVKAELGYRGEIFSAGRIHRLYFWNRALDKTSVVRGAVYFRSIAEGPPGYAHGGALATALDEVCGTLATCLVGFTGAPMPTATLNVAYKRPTPLCTPLLIEARVDRVAGRAVHMTARIATVARSSANRAICTTTAEGTAVFVSLASKRQSASAIAYLDAVRMFGRESGLSPSDFVEFLRTARKNRSKL